MPRVLKPKASNAGNLIFVLGDQLTPMVSSLAAGDPIRDVVLMCEVQEEATYVRHHKKKIAFIFSAMRHFAEGLRASGWRVDYRTLDQTAGTFTAEVEAAVVRHRPQRVIVTSPGEPSPGELLRAPGLVEWA